VKAKPEIKPVAEPENSSPPLKPDVTKT